MNHIKTWFNNQRSFFMAAPGIIWQFLFLCVPLVIICAVSFVDTTGESIQFSFVHYSHFFKLLYFKIIGRSFVLAFTTATLCLVCAYPLAYYTAFHLNRAKNLMLFFLLLPFWTSLLVLAYAWFFVLEKYGLINNMLLHLGVIETPVTLLNTHFSVYMVMLYCYLPFMTLPIYSILEKLDKRLIEASLDLGASPWQTLRAIIFPLSMSGIRTGFFLVFIPAFGEFVIPSLLGGAKEFYVGSLIVHYLLVSRNQYEGAAFTLLSGLILACVSYVLYRWFNQLVSVPSTPSPVNYYEKE
jgi:spermidine/putrescine transport system permease protein